MNVFALTSLLASVLAVSIGGLALHRNPRGMLNRLFFLLCLSGAYTSFVEFGYRQAESFDAASLWLRMGFLWTVSVSLELHFVLLYTKQTRILASRLTLALIYGPACAFSLWQLFSPDAVEPVKVGWGWTYSIAERYVVANSLLDIWVLGTTLCALYLCLRYYLETTEHTEKRQAQYVFIAFLLATVVGLGTELLPPYFSAAVPELTALGLLLEYGSVGYAMLKHGLFPLTLATAAQNVISSMSDMLLLVSAEGRIAMANQATLDLLGYDDDELHDRPMEVILARRQTARGREGWLEQLTTTESLRDVEVALRTKDAKSIPVSLSKSTVRSQDGTNRGAVYVGRDLTERKRAEEQIKASLREKDVLLQEIHHRVKNNLQIISSLLSLQSDHTHDPQVLGVCQDSQVRIHTMALVHEKLYQSESLAQIDFAEYIDSLATYVFRMYRANAQDLRLKVTAQSVRIGIDVAVPCGLILNELVSNALKHAFPDGRKGKVHIELGVDDDHQATLVVGDNGIGLSEDLDLGSVESLGLQLVALLVRQLDGTVELERRDGTAFRMTFDLLPQGS